MGSWPRQSGECRGVCTQTLWSAEPVRSGQGAKAGGELAVAGRAGRRAAGGCSGLESLSLLLFQQ